MPVINLRTGHTVRVRLNVWLTQDNYIGAAQRMANQGQLFKHQSFGYNDYCKFKRGNIGHVVEICGEPHVVMLPAKRGSGSRGSRSITK